MPERVDAAVRPSTSGRRHSCQRGTTTMGFFKDLRHSTRIVARSPGFSAIAIIALALGIGLTATMFSIVNAALYKGLPFPDSDRIVHLERTNPSAGIEGMEVSIHDFLDWHEQQRSFDGLAAYYTGTVNVRGTERAERYSGGFVTADLFPLLGVAPILGRGFQEGEDTPGAEPVMVIGFRMWQDRYGGDPGVLGETLWANGEQMTVIGVMPEGFEFPMQEQVWLAHRQNALELERGGGVTLEVVGRLSEGRDIDQATLDMNRVAAGIATEFPESNEGVGVIIKPFVMEYIGDEARNMLLAMLGATFLILVVACANVANLLLARAASRTREVAVRTALGAGRWQVVRKMMSESLVLAGAGALLGLGIAWFSVNAFVAAIQGTDPPFWLDFSFDPRVFLFVAGVTLAGALLSGLLPAIKASGADVNGILKDESRGSSGMKIGRLSRGLVVVEIALSAGLLVGAGLMIKSVARLQFMDWGFNVEDVFTARVGLFPTDYPEEADRQRFFLDLEERLAAIPGVEAASLTSSLPAMGAARSYLAIEGESYATDQDYPLGAYHVVTSDYFDAFEMEVLQGRVFNTSDVGDGEQVAVVNQPFAERFFAGEEVVGKRFRRGRSDSQEPWLTIVGVVPDFYMGGIENTTEVTPGYYTPLAQGDMRFMSIAVRTQGNPAAVAPAVRDAVAAVDRDVPIYWPRTMEDSLAQSTWFYRVFGVLFMAFGLAALFLASVGLYGVMAFSVNRRTTEVGIRMALGAEPAQVVKMIVRQGMAQIGLGLLLGAGVALLVGRAVQLLLFQVQPRDPVIFAAIATLLLMTGLVASLIPASRATRIDPVVAFRTE
jgi:predicted permease